MLNSFVFCSLLISFQSCERIHYCDIDAAVQSVLGFLPKACGAMGEIISPDHC